MTLQEAIKSGKRFRRHIMFKGEWYSNPCQHGTFDYADILADDWEIESTPVTITKEQFYEACEQVMESYAKNMDVAMINAGPRFATSINELAERLGLND
jgi:hypothetical protein